MAADVVGGDDVVGNTVGPDVEGDPVADPGGGGQTKTLDLCLAGVLARSYEETLANTKANIIEPAKAAGWTVKIHIFNIDPGNALVDGRAVSSERALARARSLLGDLTVFSVAQDHLDTCAHELDWDSSLEWLRCTLKGRPDVERELRTPYIANMYRQLQIERAVGEYLVSSQAQMAVVQGPDSLVTLDSAKFVERIGVVEDGSILVPRGSTLSGSLGIVNGFAAGSPVSLSTFFLRDKVIPFSTEDEIPRPWKGWNNWEHMCALVARRSQLKLTTVSVDIIKVRADGSTKKAWGCRPLV